MQLPQTRGAKHKIETSTVRPIIDLFIEFWNIFVVKDGPSLKLDDFKECFVQKECPQQENGYDCGLFMSAVILHLLSGVRIHEKVFTQTHITLLKARLVSTIANSSAKTFTDYDATECIPANIIRSCFPMLKWNFSKGDDPDRFLRKKSLTPPRRVTIIRHPTINDNWHVPPVRMRVKLPPMRVLQEYKYKEASESIPLSQIIIPSSITEKKKGGETGHDSDVEEVPPPTTTEKKRVPPLKTAPKRSKSNLDEVEDLDSDVEIIELTPSRLSPERALKKLKHDIVDLGEDMESADFFVSEGETKKKKAP